MADAACLRGSVIVVNVFEVYSQMFQLSAGLASICTK